MKKIFFFVLFFVLRLFSQDGEFISTIEHSVFHDGEFVKIFISAKTGGEEIICKNNLLELNNNINKIIKESTSDYKPDVKNYIKCFYLKSIENDTKIITFIKQNIELKFDKFDNNTIFENLFGIIRLIKEINIKNEALSVKIKGGQKFISQEKMHSLYFEALRRINTDAIREKEYLFPNKFVDCNIKKVEINNLKYECSSENKYSTYVLPKNYSPIQLFGEHYFVDFCKYNDTYLNVENCQFRVSVSATVIINYKSEESMSLDQEAYSTEYTTDNELEDEV